MAEAYSFMPFPTAQFSEAECPRYCLPLIPYLTLGFNWIDNIMLFYKEMVEMENCDFVTNSARCKGLTEIEFLRKLCDDTRDVIRTLCTLGKAHPGYRRFLRFLFFWLCRVPSDADAVSNGGFRSDIRF